MTEKRNLEQEIRALVADVDKTHQYSMSRIYGLYNEVFGTNERVQACASCLKRKVAELKKWLGDKQSLETAKAAKSKRKAARPKASKKSEKE